MQKKLVAVFFGHLAKNEKDGGGFVVESNCKEKILKSTVWFHNSIGAFRRK